MPAPFTLTQHLRLQCVKGIRIYSTEKLATETILPVEYICIMQQCGVSQHLALHAGPVSVNLLC